MDNRPYKIKPPKDLAEYITKVVADETYLIFDRKRDWVYCTRCGKTEKLSKQADENYRHNKKTICPFCGAEAIAKDARYGRKNITEYGRILWFRRYGRITFAELDEYRIDYTTVPARVSFWPSAQYRFCKESQDYFKHVPGGWWTEERWEKRKEVKLPYAAIGMWNGYCVPTYQKTVTHTSWISERGTDLRYANLNMERLGWKEPDNSYALIGYMANFLKYPSIEILEKAGFENLVGERANGGKCRYINWKAKDLRKILRLNKKEIRQLRESKGSIWELERYWEIRKMGIRIEFDELSLLAFYSIEEDLPLISKYAKIERSIKYLKGQRPLTTRDYADYLEECVTLGYDMDNKKILRPQDLRKAHEETSMKIEVEKDEKRAEMFAAGMRSIYDKPEYRAGNLLIRAAVSPEELHRESLALHHCVRTYVDRVCRRTCAILFIRRSDAPDVPYFTLELSPDKSIVQCRGDHNCAYPEEVAEFIELWKADVLQKKKKGAAAPAA